MDVDLLQEYISALKQMDKKEHFPFLIFCALEGEGMKEIGWERTYSANNISNILALYMTQNNLSLSVKDGTFYFYKNQS